jgi:hypothetical protein
VSKLSEGVWHSLRNSPVQHPIQLGWTVINFTWPDPYSNHPIGRTDGCKSPEPRQGIRSAVTLSLSLPMCHGAPGSNLTNTRRFTTTYGIVRGVLALRHTRRLPSMFFCIDAFDRAPPCSKPLCPSAHLAKEDCTTLLLRRIYGVSLVLGSLPNYYWRHNWGCHAH